MRLRLETELQAPADWVWQRVQTIDLLERVTWPLLMFRSASAAPLPDRWRLDAPCALVLQSFGVLPLGRHTIRLVGFDNDRRTLDFDEQGALARVWRHTIAVEPIDGDRCRYSDDLEIEGRKGSTWAVWCLAAIFYRYRQVRCRRLARLRAAQAR